MRRGSWRRDLAKPQSSTSARRLPIGSPTRTSHENKERADDGRRRGPSPSNRGLDKPAGRQARLCGRHIVPVRYIASRLADYLTISQIVAISGSLITL